MTRYLPCALHAVAVVAIAALAPLTLHGQGAQPAAQPAARDTTPRAALDTVLPRTAPLGARVDSTTDGGRFVRLADGTRWEVHPQDRPGADAWQSGQFVEVRDNPVPSGDPISGFNIVLMNAEARRAVVARFAGLAR
jgi:hypothetical protein